MKIGVLSAFRRSLDTFRNRVVACAAFWRSINILGNRKDGGRTFTILFVPHDHAPMKRYRFRRSLVYFTLLVTVVLMTAGILFPHFFLKAATQVQQMEDLARERQELLDARQDFETTIGGLRNQVQAFQIQANKFALMAGLEDLPNEDIAAGSPGRVYGMGVSNPSSLDSLKGELSVLGDQTKVLRENYEVIAEALQKQTAMLDSTPSLKPVKGMLGHGYGWRKDPFTGLRDFHPGIDIVANRGTMVFSPADALVTKVGRMGGYGNVVFLSHGNGITTRYGHLETISVKVGDKLKRGEKVGLVGSTGRSTGPHLHYEVLVHNQKVNPLHYIIQEFRRF